MECDSRWVFTALIIGIVAIYDLLKRANEWIYVRSLDRNMQEKLPPGHLGWPLIGNMWSLFRALNYGDPESFINSFIHRYGSAPMYRAFLFGNPTIIVTTADECRKVLNDERFELGYPKSLIKLLGETTVLGKRYQERKRLRQLVQSPIAGQEALTSFVYYINAVAETSFQEWEKINQPIEFLTEMKKASFKALMKVFFSNEIDQHSLGLFQREFNVLADGLMSMSINFPGFAYHKALKARNNLFKMFKEIVYKRRTEPCSDGLNTKKDLLTLLMEASDSSGNALIDEDIISLLLAFSFAGHESTSLTITWAIIFLEENPHILRKAKEEQEDIVKRRTSSETGLAYYEIKEMKYLRKVINETLRLISVGLAIHRKAQTDINVNVVNKSLSIVLDYIIPRGWKVLAWHRNVHFDPQNYENPNDFNPSRWKDVQGKARAFLPFGAGSRFCPGSDLAILQISVYLHCFLLNYRLHRMNPKSKVEYFMVPKPADKCLARVRKFSP